MAKNINGKAAAAYENNQYRKRWRIESMAAASALAAKISAQKRRENGVAAPAA
jgi:hypothetical protein